MDEQEVLRKLGFESEAELLSVKQLAKYHPIYATDYFDLSMKRKLMIRLIAYLSIKRFYQSFIIVFTEG